MIWFILYSVMAIGLAPIIIGKLYKWEQNEQFPVRSETITFSILLSVLWPLSIILALIVFVVRNEFLKLDQREKK